MANRRIETRASYSGLRVAATRCLFCFYGRVIHLTLSPVPACLHPHQVVSVYLFHELPETIRRAASAEFYRVLRPGGVVVLTDSVQLGDRPAWDNTIGLFGDFNEPYYR